MQPPACVRADPLLLSRSPSGARDQEQQVQLRQKLRELPALLRSGLTLRRKNSAAGGRVSGRASDTPPPIPESPNRERGALLPPHAAKPSADRWASWAAARASRECPPRPLPPLLSRPPVLCGGFAPCWA